MLAASCKVPRMPGRPGRHFWRNVLRSLKVGKRWGNAREQKRREVPMAETAWHIRGDYFESCSCDYLCPCIYTNMAARPSKGSFTAALAFHIEEGGYGTVVLDGLNFVVALRSPGEMAAGNWVVGLILDERATAEQQQALTAIASGQAGGPMAGLAPLLGQFLGTESRPIHYQRQG